MIRKKFTIFCALLSIAVFLIFIAKNAMAVTTYGTLGNFDVINDTGGDCHGFEIELEGISPSDVVYTFGAPYQRYGDPVVVYNSTNTGAIVRYTALYDSSNSTWSAATPYTPSCNLVASGHSCWTGGVSNPNDYYSCGCDHFGVSLIKSPTKTTYRWLIEGSTPGTLTPFGSDVALPAPSWNVIPPAVPAAQPQVFVAIVAPEPEGSDEFGEALWVKIFKTELEDGLREDDLVHLVIDDADIDIVPDEPGEVEIEWTLLQQSTEDEGEQEFGGEVGEGNEAVSRRFEFYRYIGEYDPETHEALCDNPDDCPEAVGDFVGDQNVAIDLAGLFEIPAEPTPSPTLVSSPTPVSSPKPTEPPNAIALSSFEAKADDDGSVIITWETATEVDNAGFNLYRAKRREGSYARINEKLIEAKGDATSGAAYSYRDVVDHAGGYFYKLEDIDTNGESTMHGPIKVRVNVLE
ncbi:MAG: hypothetical protein FJ266_15735 [Planctomycetes bacterium]|nr:hypothetical protein [Planctomycetota bacterium]